MSKLTFKGQSLLELVVGISLIAAVLTALVVTTTYSLRNTQFSKNQSLATKFAQENLEKVRTIKIANYGVCLNGQDPLVNCSTWEEDIWVKNDFGNLPTCDDLPSPTCTFEFRNAGCTVGGETKDPCLIYKTTPSVFPGSPTVFTYQIYIENEVPNQQKRITSKVFWTDSTGQHSSDLVTVFSKL